MNILSKKLNTIIFSFFFVVTQSSGQNLDTVSIIKDIRGKYQKITNKKDLFSYEKIVSKPEAIFDIFEGDTMELENAFDGGYIEIYRDHDKKIRLISYYENFTAAVNWSTEKYYYLWNNELFFYFEIYKSELPYHDEKGDFYYAIIEKRMYFYQGETIRYLVKKVEGYEGFEVLENKMDYVKNKYKSNFKSAGKLPLLYIEDLRNSNIIK